MHNRKHRGWQNLYTVHSHLPIHRLNVMADKSTTTRKKPVSQKRVAVVLASLVGTMTISAGALLLMEGGALGTSVPGAFVAGQASLSLSAGTSDHTLVSLPLQGKAWNYIIVYESADASVSAESLAEGRVTGGSDPSKSVRSKANFHFVIEMGGTLKTGTSWQKQEPGAPYASWPDSRSYSFTPYTNAVGICLAADINHGTLSQAQHDTLLQTVRDLQRLYNIPKENVLFQWDRRLDAHGAKPATSTQLRYDAQFRSQLD
jgi:hypothetical protein